MTFREFFFKPSAKGRWSSWWAMFLTCPLVVGLLIGIWESHCDSTFANRQLATTGVVTAYTPEDHNLCRYVFSVQGKSFEGQDSALRNPQPVGKAVTVFYDATDPSASGLEDYTHRGKREGGLIPICLFGIFLIPTIILFNKFKKASR